MTDLALASRVLLIVFTSVAAVTDWRTRRIPNWLTVSSLALGTGLQAWLGGWAGLQSAGYGLGVALAIGLPLYLLRGLGGGDVKMMAAAGAITGPMNFLYIFLINAVLGGVVAIVLVVYKGRLRRTLWNVATIVRALAHLRAPHEAEQQLDLASPDALTLPRGPVFAAAAVVFVVMI